VIVVDTSAIIAILADEPERHAFQELIGTTQDILISAFTVFECSTVIRSRFPIAALSDFETLLREGAFDIAPFDSQQATLASAAYARFGKGPRSGAKLNLGDCVSYALAVSRDLPLLFKGDDFSRTDVRSALP